MNDEVTTAWVVARWVVALIAAAIILAGALVVATGGSHNNLNAGVVLGIAFALLPAGIYAVGAGSRRAVVLAGVVLLGVTGAAWSVFVLNRRNDFAWAFIVPAFVITLLSSSLAKQDGRRR